MKKFYYKPDCCENGSWYVYIEPGRDTDLGPLEDGYCMRIKTLDSYKYINILYCPFCAKDFQNETFEY